jgi:abnormal spindle-like microcephaly-associated protein
VSDEFQAGIWLRQQELAFIAWLNHTIVIDDVGTMGDDSPSANRGGNASAREVRQTVRNKLTSLYSYDDELGRVLKKTYRHVDNARFRLNTGQTFMDNVALKEEFARALSCFSPFWLQLGVDVVVGGGIVWKRRGDLHEIQKECIAALFRDRDLEIEFGTGHVPGAPPFAHGYEEALSRSVLKRVLLLVFILDRAAMSGLPPNTPLLMRPHAALKRSEDILRTALQGSMYGEGDVIRNLSQCSYKLHYKQNPIREYDFQCTNLAVDLRDGVRLCRLMEVLNADVLFMSYDEKNKEWKRSLLSEVHFPCASRAHRVQNVEVALRAIKDQQVGLPGTWSRIKAEDIVDGHLEHTMGLLWALMMHYSAPGLLLPKSLDSEITRLGGKVPDIKRIERLSAARRGDSVIEAPQCAMEARLYAWARAACATQNVELNNLGGAFTDGRALCALIRAYAPMMIPKRRIGNAPLKLDDANADTAKHARELARDNFAAVAKALQALGGVPNPTFDIRFTSDEGLDSPDPRAVSGYLLFLSARLLLLRQQEVACVRIQRWWRWNRPNRPKFAEVVRKWNAASTVIASHVRRVQAVDAVNARKNAIVKLQSFRRACVARREFLNMKNAAVKIQSFKRMHTARLEFQDTKWAVEKVQKMRRGCAQRNQFLRKKQAATLIQGWYRTVCARNEYVNKTCAATIIQMHWRAFAARAEAKRIVEARMKIIHSAATKIQAAFRKCMMRKHFLRLRWFVILSQARARAAAARRTFVAQKKASVTIQRRVRRFLDYNAYKRRSQMIENERQKKAATTIQRHWRGYSTRDGLDNIQWKTYFVTLLQAYVRRWQTRRKFVNEILPRQKELKLQARKTQMRARMAREREAATCIQKFCRGHLARKTVRKMRRKASKAKRAEKDAAANLLQKEEKSSEEITQRSRRPVSAFTRKALLEQHVVVIQAFVRGWLARKHAVHKLEWHRKRIAAKAQPVNPLHARAEQAANMIAAPHARDDCLRGCTFFTEHWNLSKTCRGIVTSPRVLHALMRNVRQCSRSASQVPLLTAAYDLFEIIARDKHYASALEQCPDSVMTMTEHLQQYRDRPTLLESAVNTMVALFENSSNKRSLVSEKFLTRVEKMRDIIDSNRIVHRRRAMTFAQQGRYKEETEARDALVKTEQTLACLKKLTRTLT